MLGHEYVLLMKLLPSIVPQITVQVCKRKYLSQNLRTMPHSLLLGLCSIRHLWTWLYSLTHEWHFYSQWRYGSLCFPGSWPSTVFCHFSLRSSPNPSWDTHTSARRRSLHYAPLGFGAIQRVERVSLPLVPRVFCPQPRQTIRILRQQRKLPLIHSRMCSSNQYPAHPVKKKVLRAPLVRLSHLRTGLYV